MPFNLHQAHQPGDTIGQVLSNPVVEALGNYIAAAYPNDGWNGRLESATDLFGLYGMRAVLTGNHAAELAPIIHELEADNDVIFHADS